MENESNVVYENVKSQVNTLRKCSIGVAQRLIFVKSSRKLSSRNTDEDDISNVFDITIEMAGVEKVWEITFDVENLDISPDITLPEENSCFSPDLSAFMSVKNWNITCSSSLERLILEVYEAYCKHQRDCVKEFHIKEFEDLLNTVECAKHSEIQILKNDTGTFNDVITLLIPLQADFTSLPPLFCEEQDQVDWCCLSMKFEAPSLSRVTAILKFSPTLSRCMGEGKDLKIPSYCSPLAEYVSNIEQLLQNSVNSIADNYDKRKQFIFGLLSKFKSCVLEYDAHLFVEASFLLDVQGFHFVLYVKLPYGYPHICPNVSLQSIYNHGNNKTLLVEALRGFDYRSSVYADIQIQEIWNAILEILPNFKSKVLRGH